jgi:hypothetical protein
MQLNLEVIRETAAETASKLGAIAKPEVFYRVRRNNKTIELKDFTSVIQKIEAQQFVGSDQISVTRNGVVSPVWTRLVDQGLNKPTISGR